jgi:argonaute-like protein implicated in RNA metabolism and viral defense
LEKPKKKNEKHYQIVKQIPGFILEPLSKEETLTDAMIYRAVKAYDQSISRRQ